MTIKTRIFLLVLVVVVVLGLLAGKKIDDEHDDDDDDIKALEDSGFTGAGALLGTTRQPNRPKRTK